MKNTLRILVLFSATLTFTSLQAQPASGNDELSGLATNYGKEQVVKISDENSTANLNYSENLSHKITALPEFIPTRKYKNADDFIYSKIQFPEEAREMGLSGVVKVQFDIHSDGSIGNVTFLQSPDKVFNSEVRKIVASMPNWQPAYSESVPVNSRYQLNINFLLR